MPRPKIRPSGPRLGQASASQDVRIALDIPIGSESEHHGQHGEDVKEGTGNAKDGQDPAQDAQDRSRADRPVSGQLVLDWRTLDRFGPHVA